MEELTAAVAAILGAGISPPRGRPTWGKRGRWRGRGNGARQPGTVRRPLRRPRHRLLLFLRRHRRHDTRRDRAGFRLVGRAAAGRREGPGDRPDDGVEAGGRGAAAFRGSRDGPAGAGRRIRRRARHAGAGARCRGVARAQSRSVGETAGELVTSTRVTRCEGTMRLLAGAVVLVLAGYAGGAAAQSLPPGVSPRGGACRHRLHRDLPPA